MYNMRQFSAYRDKNWRVRSLRGVLDDLMRLPLLDNHAVVHENDPVGNVSGKRHLMRHDDHGHFLLGKRPDHAQHLARELGVQRGSRLVEAEDVGF